MCIRVLTKADLCRIFGLYSARSGNTYPKRLRQIYFTDSALDSLNISVERYRSAKTFTYEESQRIIEHFKIESYEIQES